MTVNELIKSLQRIEDKEKEISIFLDKNTQEIIEQGKEVRVTHAIERKQYIDLICEEW